MLSDNERGFMFLSAIFLMLIVSIMAMMILNTNIKVQQRNPTLYFTAINLANEQFAILESNTGVSIPADDKKSCNGLKEDAEPIEFKVSTSSNGDKYTVRVEWSVNDQTEIFESTKIIYPASITD